MALVASHYERDKNKRKAKVGKVGESYFRHPAYKRSEALIDEIYCDICNGASRSDVLEKMMGGIYEGCREHKYGYEQAEKYWLCALQRFEYDVRLSPNEIKNVLLGKYNAVYQDAIEMGDRSAAIRCLDSLAKIAGLFDNKPTTAVQINSNDKEVTINFGLNNNDEG